MSRALIILDSVAARGRASNWVMKAPHGTRVEFKAAKRSLPQNERMWAMLTDVAMQKDHHGKRYTPDQWKIIFMAAIGREVQFIPSLDGTSFIPWGQSSSDLSKAEMTALLDFIEAWGTEAGVVFHDDELVARRA